MTEKDPAESAEGGLDPLGTEPLADALATRLAPGVRERMSHPRFLTAIAVSLEVCRDFDDETIATDQVSEPSQVFEWYLVEGLVRTAEAAARLGLPGSLKASRAIADGVPLSAKRYLKPIFYSKSELGGGDLLKPPIFEGSAFPTSKCSAKFCR